VRIRERFAPLVELCKSRGVAMRIGTNHGSLSDRIMNRFGDSPRGMVESALEFARIARDLGYHDFVFSMKSSNPKVMIGAYRLLISRLNEEDQLARKEAQSQPGRVYESWNYPIHLGVTEAGDGEDARIKSAIGIGSLLADGIGDTLRVSLTEDSVHEIPVARALVASYNTATSPADAAKSATFALDRAAGAYCADFYSYSRRRAEELQVVACASEGGLKLGGEQLVRVAVRQPSFDKIAHKVKSMGDYQPELVVEAGGILSVDPRDLSAMEAINGQAGAKFVTVSDGLDLPGIAAFRLLASRLDPRHPILLKDTLHPSTDSSAEFLPVLLRAATQIGSLLCDGIGDAILVQGEEAPGQALRLSYNILQAAGSRIFKTDYVACPSCGRTLFNLQTTTARIKAATVHLKGVKIAIMGCIVNGPGEMADADFGYVGGAPGKVNLYVGKTPVKFNIPEIEAVDRLKDLIREHGKWVDPAVAV
jgi:(E)-4-hydroxy-3-methylbut-2-enyl-diphosphate synthase